MRPGQSCPGVVLHVTASGISGGRGFNEAGAIMPRSGAGSERAPPPPPTASMRPGQSCPGVGTRPRAPARARVTASMRPGQSCPGVGRRPILTPATANGCFNEAGAIMPRSGHAREKDVPRVASAGFNEAGAIMPRSGADVARDRILARVASMRPGQSCPGVARSQGEVHASAAEASMRPGQSCPGVGPHVGQLRRPGNRASMRPEQSCPGVVEIFLVSRHQGRVASMRPGQSCPGVGIETQHLGRRAQCFNEAGAIMPRSGPSPPVARPPRRGRFNEAGAIMPRSGCTGPSGR